MRPVNDKARTFRTVSSPTTLTAAAVLSDTFFEFPGVVVMSFIPAGGVGGSVGITTVLQSFNGQQNIFGPTRVAAVGVRAVTDPKVGAS